MLDPQRIGLNAESVGFLKRTRQDVDWEAYRTALQTDYNNQNSAVQVRRERDAKKTEIRIMGGERSGFESNELILTQDRQRRQINGYPLRQFSADSPAVVLPRKYGGFPLYNKNQTEYPELVSVFTEPMSAPLQQNTELLGRLGQVAMSNDSIRPFEEEGFVNPMNRTYDQLVENEGQFRQRAHLRKMSNSARARRSVADMTRGVYISENGQPMSQVVEPAMTNNVTVGSYAQKSSDYSVRQANFMTNRENIDATGVMLRQDYNNGMANIMRSINSLGVVVTNLGDINERNAISVDQFGQAVASFNANLYTPKIENKLNVMLPSAVSTGANGLPKQDLLNLNSGTPGAGMVEEKRGRKKGQTNGIGKSQSTRSKSRKIRGKST